MIDIKKPKLNYKDLGEINSFFHSVLDNKRIYEVKTIKYKLTDFYKYLKSIGINNLSLSELMPYGVKAYRISILENIIELVIRKEYDEI